MNTAFEIAENNLINSLEEIRKQVIGICKIHGNIELLVEKNKSTFTTISIGNLGGISTSHYSVEKYGFLIKRFPKKYKNMWEFLKDPIEFNYWWNEKFK